MTDQPICPAYAGMILELSALSDKVTNLSRVCGDDPLLSASLLHSRKICPAYAGMILIFIKVCTVRFDLSRVCGDDPARIGIG